MHSLEYSRDVLGAPIFLPKKLQLIDWEAGLGMTQQRMNDCLCIYN
jgi:hypothetical protein